jgi:hypothetical protein
MLWLEMQSINISLDKTLLERLFSASPLPEVSDKEVQSVLDCGEVVRLKHSSGNTNSARESSPDGALRALSILISGKRPSL